MSKVIKSNFHSTILTRDISRSSKQVAFWDNLTENLKKYAPPIGTLSFLVLWVNMCYEHNLHFREALICSLIIGSITLLRLAD